MRLKKLQIRGFESFSDSGEVAFADCINLIVGQNNAGKSSLLRSLRVPLLDHRHRTSIHWDDFELATPVVHRQLELPTNELRREILRVGQRAYIPVNFNLGDDEARQFVQSLFNSRSISVDVASRPGHGTFSSDYPSHRHFPNSGNYKSYMISPFSGEFRYDGITAGTAPQDSLPELAWQMWTRQMFYFSPERFSVGRSTTIYAERLESDASNLPAVLQRLNGEQGDTFQRLVTHLREIFPTVGNLSVRTDRDGGLEIRVWPTQHMQRLEQSFPLNNSGTGVAQVIAILTAIMTMESSVVVVDEINSFLHPSAVKALLRIIQAEYSEHQYIISTHAPEVISSANPSTVHLIRRSGYESSVTQIALTDVGSLKDLAQHLGVSMADVFAADRVIWVEGPTEEECFTHLYRTTQGPLPSGTVFASVVSTGDFISRTRDRQLVYEIYEKISSATANLVVSVSFSFDSEQLSPTEREDMERRSANRVHFLPRRHIECYMINPAAIAAFISGRDFSQAEVTAERVADMLSQGATRQEFRIPEWTDDLSNANWLRNVDAANLINWTCQEITEARVDFRKKGDSLQLLQHILSNAPEELAELEEYVRSLVSFRAA